MQEAIPASITINKSLKIGIKGGESETACPQTSKIGKKFKKTAETKRADEIIVEGRQGRSQKAPLIIITSKERRIQ
jgi:hypothetical protein